MSRKCPKGYTMVNGVCSASVSSQQDISYMPDWIGRDTCCSMAQDALAGCHSHPGQCGWSPSGCTCTQQAQWMDSNWQYTYCICSPASWLVENLIWCCGYGGRGGKGGPSGSGNRGWGGRRRGGKIKRRPRRMAKGGLSNPNETQMCYCSFSDINQDWGTGTCVGSCSNSGSTCTSNPQCHDADSGDNRHYHPGMGAIIGGKGPGQGGRGGWRKGGRIKRRKRGRR